MLLPGWSSPRLALRMHPLEHEFLRKQSTKISVATKGAKARVELATSAAIIADATDAVVIGEDDDGSGVPAGEIGLKDPDFLAGLDLEPDATNLSILRALTLGKDGVILQLAGKVHKLSGYAELEADEDFAGE